MFFQHFHKPVLASSIICTSVCRPFWLVAFSNNTKSTRDHSSTVTYFCELRALLRVIHHLPSQNVSLKCFFKNQNDPVFYINTSTGPVYLQIHQNPKLIWKYEVEASNLFKCTNLCFWVNFSFKAFINFKLALLYQFSSFKTTHLSVVI